MGRDLLSWAALGAVAWLLWTNPTDDSGHIAVLNFYTVGPSGDTLRVPWAGWGMLVGGGQAIIPGFPDSVRWASPPGPLWQVWVRGVDSSGNEADTSNTVLVRPVTP
jgi:hypothetical protein